MNLKNIKNNRKLIIALIIFIFLVSIISAYCFSIINSNKLNKEKNINESDKGIKDIKEESFTFKDIAVEHDDNNSVFTYSIVNDSNEVMHLGEYYLIIKSSDGEIISYIAPNYNIDLEPGEKYEASNTINIKLPKDVMVDIKMKEE